MPEEIKKSQKKEKNYDIEPGHLPQAEVIYSPAQVISMKDAGADGFQVVPLTQSEGYISAEYAYLYPPGSPMLVPGERITAQIREHFQWYMERTYEIQGVEKVGYIEVWTHGYDILYNGQEFIWKRYIIPEDQARAADASDSDALHDQTEAGR